MITELVARSDVFTAVPSATQQPARLAVTRVAGLEVPVFQSEFSWEPYRDLPGLAYLLAEFPSQWLYQPHLSSTISNSLADFFVSFLPRGSRVEQVYWASEGSILRIWTIIDKPDYTLEAPIYKAQLQFMDRFPELDCDFSVIYRFGKAIEQIRPEGANSVPIAW